MKVGSHSQLLAAPTGFTVGFHQVSNTHKVGGNGQERSSSKTFSPGNYFELFFDGIFLQFVAILSYFFAISDIFCNCFSYFLANSRSNFEPQTFYILQKNK